MDDIRGGARTFRPARKASGRIYRRRRVVVVTGLVLVILLAWLGISLGSALTNPAYGSSLSARFAEWARQNHGGAAGQLGRERVVRTPPAPGGRKASGGCHPPPEATPKMVSRPGRPILPPPAPIAPLASPPIAGEGQWSPAGRTRRRDPCRLRHDPRDPIPSTRARWWASPGWTPSCLRATLYSGSQIPGGGPYQPHRTDPPRRCRLPGGRLQRRIPHVRRPTAATTPTGEPSFRCRTGAASFVVYRDGSATVGAVGTGRDA